MRSFHFRSVETDSNSAICVTGASGSGKSTLVAHFHRTVRNARRVRSVLVDARRRDRRDIIEEIQQRLGVENQRVAGIVEQLRRHEKPITLCVDGVDALDDDQANLFTTDFLLPLVEKPTAVRLIVSAVCPPEGLRDIGRTLDLDSEAYFDQNEMIDFVAQVLAPGDDSNPFNSYAELRAAAVRIAARCGSSFYMADMLARFGAYHEEDDVPDTLTTLRTEVRRRDLDVEWSIGLLAPLAFAEGPGIPDFTLWLEVARRSTGTAYSAGDLDRLLEALRDVVVTEVYAQPEQACWRLENEFMVGELVAVGNGRTMHEAFTDALLATLSWTAPAPLAWDLAGEYMRRHLAIHARKAGRLTNLLEDPGFLLTADVTRARRALFIEGSEKSTAVRRILDRLTDPYGGISADRAAQLNYLARTNGLETLADRAERLPCAWRTLWAGHDGPGARVFAPCENEGQELLVTGYADGTIRFLRLSSGRSTLFNDATSGMVTGLAVGKVSDQLHALAGAFDGSVHLFNMVTGKATIIAESGPSVIGCAIVEKDLVVASDRGCRFTLVTRTNRGGRLTQATSSSPHSPVASSMASRSSCWADRLGLWDGTSAQGARSGLCRIRTGAADPGDVGPPPSPSARGPVSSWSARSTARCTSRPRPVRTV